MKKNTGGERGSDAPAAEVAAKVATKGERYVGGSGKLEGKVEE